MKYGYLFYQKPLIPEMPSRPINIGDPIQSYAVKLLYKEMGIKEEDIIPVPRYDMRNYNGEECICVVNTCTTYEELAYDSEFMPPSNKVHAIPISLHVHRMISGDELDFYKHCTGVGCRDEYTARTLDEQGVNTYLSGCLTITFPRRSKELDERADKIYLIDVQSDFKKFIPKEIIKEAVELSNIHRFKITHNSNRMTREEAFDFHRMGEERVMLLRDTAKLVITSRLHVATPCLAMGIPVIITKHDDRFGFIDRFLPSYTNWSTDKIDWNPKPVDMEHEKSIIKQVFFDRVRELKSRIELSKMWENKRPVCKGEYKPQSVSAIEKVKFPCEYFKYAILGIVSNAAYYVESEIRRLYPKAELVCGIDSYVTRDFCGVKTIHPNRINELDEDIIVITSVPGAFESAKVMLENRPHIFLRGNNIDCFNMQ